MLTYFWERRYGFFAGLEKLAITEKSSSPDSNKKAEQGLFRENINGEDIKIWGEIHRAHSTYQGDASAIRIRVCFRGSEQHVLSFDLHVESKLPADHLKTWTVTDWLLEDSKVFKRNKREEKKPYLVLPVRLHESHGRLADEISLQFEISVKCIQARALTVERSAIWWSATSTVHDDMRRMLTSGICSDMTISLPCWNWKMAVHKCILASRSRALQAMLESQMSEASTRVLTMVDIHPAAVRKFIQLLYLGKLEEEEGEESLTHVLDTAVLCDKYERPDLADLCCSVCKSLLPASTSTELVCFLSRSRGYDFTRMVRDCALDVLAQTVPVQDDIEDIQVLKELLIHLQKQAYSKIPMKRDFDDGSTDSRDSRRRRLG